MIISGELTPASFLQCATPIAWLECASENLPTLLIDHAHCEKKAASTALNLMFRYPDKPELLKKMAQLAREELLHFEQVLALMEARNVAYDHLSPSRYANGLRAAIGTTEPQRLVDTLIVGAIIEARSCERFAALSQLVEGVDAELAKYYRFLLKSESRHFLDYLELARQYSAQPIEQRVAELLAIDAELIESRDPQFSLSLGSAGVCGCWLRGFGQLSDFVGNFEPDRFDFIVISYQDMTFAAPITQNNPLLYFIIDREAMMIGPVRMSMDQ